MLESLGRIAEELRFQANCRSDNSVVFVRPPAPESRARATAEVTADGLESSIDLGPKALHRSHGPEGDDRHDESIFNEVLARLRAGNSSVVQSALK